MIGQTISHYKITEKLGEGGMGVVYKAEDTKLDRRVALKFLASHLLRDEDARRRFHREAQAAAALDHPNICTVYEIDEVESQIFIAMAYLEGQRLSEKIEAGPLKMSEALEIARQVAEALAAAHSKGVVHRDIKPANIMLVEHGASHQHVKIMDFGLADLAGRPRLTLGGRMMGTVAYMSPEQTIGTKVDHRTDIWALGVVLHEMIAGQHPFKGHYGEAVMYSIANEEPEPLTALRTGVPMELEWIVGKALAKDAAERYQHAEELAVDLAGLRKRLESTKSTTVQTPVVGEPGIYRRPGTPQLLAGKHHELRHEYRRTILEVALAALLAVALMIIAALWPRSAKQPDQSRVIRFALTPGNAVADPVISPNGRHIAYVAGRTRQTLWVHNLDQQEPRELAGTEDASYPFWSPDSNFIGFASGGELKKIPVGGGLAISLGQIAGRMFWGGTWSPDGRTVVFSAGGPGRLYEVPSRGGTPKLLIEPQESQQTLAWWGPQFLPLADGRRVLLFAVETSGEFQIVLRNLDTGQERVLGDGCWPTYSPSGHVLAQGSFEAGLLLALPFSIETFEPVGEAFAVAQNGHRASVSADGTMVYFDPSVQNRLQLVWRDRGSERLQVIGQPQESIWDPQLSPDGRRVAFVAVDNDVRDVWLHDVSESLKTRLTFDEDFEYGPIWSPSGEAVTFAVDRGTVERDIVVKPVDLSTKARRLAVSPPRGVVLDWSPDERYLLCFGFDPNAGTGSDLWYLQRQEDDRSYEAVPFLKTSSEERAAQFSPDGRFVAYSSDESGQHEVYVQLFRGGGGKWQVSQNGGGQPRWGKNGKELFYVEGDRLVAVKVTTKPTFAVGSRKTLFQSRGLGRVRFRGTDAIKPQYDVSPDGQRFVIAEPVEDAPNPTIRVVQNWHEGFRDREQD